MRAMAWRTCARTPAQSTSGSVVRTPNRPAPRTAWAACAAASSALEGMQPWFRQSPPISARSTRATFSPSAAEMAPEEHHAPGRRRHAEPEVRVEGTHRICEGDQSRRPDRQAFVVPEAIGGVAKMVNAAQGRGPRERVPQRAICEARREVQEGLIVAWRGLAGRSQEDDAPAIALRAHHHGAAGADA